MGSIKRGLRNVLRSPIRTALVVALLSISIGLAVSMLAVNGAVGQRLEEVNQQLTPDITVRPAGSFGFMGGGEPLKVSDLAPVETMAHVVTVQKTAMSQYTGTALQSAIDAGTLGRRFFGGGSGGQGGPPGGTGQGEFQTTISAPITVMGSDPIGSGAEGQVTLFGGGVAQVTAGRSLTSEDSGAYVAIMGSALAEKNGLQVGSTFEVVEGSPVEVVGLFQSGQRFGDNTIVMPFDTLQKVFGLDGEVNQATVVVDSVQNLKSVADAIKSALGTDKVDVITDADRLTQANSALEGASGSTRTGTLAGLGAGAAVIVFAMTMVVRDRRREIGVLKAIGASNRQVALQFAVESGAIALVAVVLALGVALVAVQPVADQVLASNNTAPMMGQFGRFVGGDGQTPAFRDIAQQGRQFGGFFGGVGNLEAGLTAGSALAAGFSGIALALGAALVASLSIARIRPAEVLRGE
ncbi:MAG: FtsX-like permease family protein [Chloroflexi bacterium]|nr:FtsX-like permease family protein [Chloroflexota bacterium]